MQRKSRTYTPGTRPDAGHGAHKGRAGVFLKCALRGQQTSPVEVAEAEVQTATDRLRGPDSGWCAAITGDQSGILRRVPTISP